MIIKLHLLPVFFLFLLYLSYSASAQTGLKINHKMRLLTKSIRDGEEYNLIGSTEHVEGRLEEIRRNGFAYCTYIS